MCSFAANILLFRQDDVRLAGQVLDVFAEAISGAVEHGADEDFGFRVLSFDPAHVPAAALFCEVVHAGSKPYPAVAGKSRWEESAVAGKNRGVCGSGKHELLFEEWRGVIEGCMAPEFKKSMSQKLRMDGRDYSRPGWYFLTLGADYHRHYFGRVTGCEMRPNELGQLVERCWREIPQHYDHVELGAWQVMPNHFHGLIRIMRSGGKGLGEVVNVFKGAVTREARRRGLLEVSRYSGKGQVWAPNYYDVICFDAEELAIRENYVRANPRRWALREVPVGRFEGGFYKGNLAMLKDGGPRRALRISRQAAESEVLRFQEDLMGFDGIVFSTFFSPGERACLKTFLKGRVRVVWVLPTSLPRSVPAVWAEAFLEERALWISPYPDGMQDASRASCEQANRLVLRLRG